MLSKDKIMQNVYLRAEKDFDKIYTRVYIYTSEKFINNFDITRDAFIFLRQLQSNKRW